MSQTNFENRVGGALRLRPLSRVALGNFTLMLSQNRT